MAEGGVHGFPVVDVRVECFDGKYHSVDSSEMSFKMAGSLGFKEAHGQGRRGGARADLARSKVTVPAAYQGDVHGRPQRPPRPGAGHRDRASDGEQEIIALVPTSEIMRYAIDLRSMTGGRGRFSAEHDHYDVLPAHLLDRAKASLKATQA